MSLVNDMLRDLDRRRRSPLQGNQPDTVFGHVLEEKGSTFRVAAAVVVVGILIGLAAGYFLTGQPVPGVDNSESRSVAVQPTMNTPPAASGGNEQAAESNPVVSARIAGGRETPTGFEIRIEASAEVPFEILSRTDNSLELLVRNVGEIGNVQPVVEGMTVRQDTEGMILDLALTRDADFLVYESPGGERYALTVEGFWAEQPAAPESVAGNPDVTQPVAGSAGSSGDIAPAPVTQNDTASSTQTENRTAAPAADGQDGGSGRQVRTARELTLQERDRNASQQALRLAQDGQLPQAYDSLYHFLADNPQAHQSRTTLITMLFAQEDYEQASALVEEGLSLAPNHIGYKKIKARLLMMRGEYIQAIRLLNNLPPLLSEDTEYYELLASLYQQVGNHNAAIETYQELIRQDSSVGRWWTGMAISHEAQGDTEDALNSYRVAMQLPDLESSLRQYSQNRIRALARQ